MLKASNGGNETSKMSRIGKHFFSLVRKERRKLTKLFGVRRIGLFGSAVKSNAKKVNDADVLVDFKEKTFDNYMGLKFFLEEHLGVKVDLVITETLKPAIKSTVLSEVKYAA